jgi:hypothetical protein
MAYFTSYVFPLTVRKTTARRPFGVVMVPTEYVIPSNVEVVSATRMLSSWVMRENPFVPHVSSRLEGIKAVLRCRDVVSVPPQLAVRVAARKSAIRVLERETNMRPTSLKD